MAPERTTSAGGRRRASGSRHRRLAPNGRTPAPAGGSERPGRAPRITRSRTIDPSALTGEQLSRFGSELFDLHDRIFAGLDEEAFVDYVLRSKAARTRIRIYENAAQETVGYCAIHLYRKKISGSDLTILRAEAGLLPEYRGRSVTYYFGMVETLKHLLRHPFDRLYYLGLLVHPSSYHLFCKFFRTVYPSHRSEVPPAVIESMIEMADAFDVPAVTEADPLVRDIGWITRESEQERRLSARTDLPDVIFFRARNPDYGKGYGLVVLVPLTVRNEVTSFLRYLLDFILDWAGIRRRVL